MLTKLGGNWPLNQSLFTPRRTINTWDLCAGGVGTFSSVSTSTAWPTANLAMYWPIMISSPVLVTSMFVVNGGTVSGNVAIAVYTPDGTKVGGTAATAHASANAIQSINPTANFEIGPGLYYMGLVFDNGTATTRAFSIATLSYGRMMGVFQQASAYSSGAPATATFASNAQVALPQFGFVCSVLPAGNTPSLIIPATIHTMHPLSIGVFSANYNAIATTSTSTAATASRALYVPFTVPSTIIAKNCFFYAGGTSANTNNWDFGVYTDSGVRLVSIGSTAQSGTINVLNTAALTATELAPGQYYMALALNSTDTYRATIGGSAVIPALAGVQTQSSAFALPATATMASGSSDIPLFGFTTQAVV